MNANNLPTRNLRRADANRIFQVLKDQHARKLDVVMPATALRAAGEDGRTYLSLDHVHLDSDGVHDLTGLYSLTPTAVGNLATDYGIPVGYLRRCREENQRAFVNAINDWARYDDDRNVLVRLLLGTDRGDKNSKGIVRAVLSDSYGFSDNLDMATAFLQGVRAAGLDDTQIVDGDMTDDHLYMRVSAPQIAMAAPDLLRGYRSPFTGQSGAECPTVFAGVVFRNSETGRGRASVAPELRIEVCGNGATFAKRAVTQVHRGAKIPKGIRLQRDTYAALDHAFALQVRDAVRGFLTPKCLEEMVNEISGDAQVPLPDPESTLTVVSKQLHFTEAERNGIWEHFLTAGDRTAGGILHAVTSYAQVIGSNDSGSSIERSNEFGVLGLEALTLAAGHARRVVAI